MNRKRRPLGRRFLFALMIDCRWTPRYPFAVEKGNSDASISAN